jgi:hypothetical protein
MLIAWVLLLGPLSARAFEAVDVLTPSNVGRYPAYPSEPVPLRNYWVQFGGMYDSNILRLPTGENDAFVSRLGAGGRAEQRVYGRQRVYVEGRIDGYLYNNYGDLDNVGWGGLGEWRWELGNDWSGVLGGSVRQFQASLSETQRPEEDRITEKRAVGTAAWQVGPHLRARGGVEFLNYNRPALAEANTNNLIGTLGLDYITALGNAIGVEMHEARGDAPVNQLVDPTGQFVNNDYRQRDVSLLATWIMPYLRFGGRYGRTERRYTELPGRDFTGPTWQAAVDYLPGNKTVLTLEASKHISSLIEIGASHAVVKTVAFGPGWAPTAKLNFSARWLRQQLDYEGDPEAALGLAPVRRETLRGIRLGSYWEYTRQWHFQFAIDHGTRTSNLLDRDYKYNALMGNVRYNFW